ncbi:MAG: hypothetical protein JWL62_2627 [Hyphomicrobiales bacterium]|nr:hypothetical protein [Hyphomicrobiales bacterium]
MIAADEPVLLLRVLIAEDVASSRMLLEGMLRKMGHHVVAVSNGVEAVEQVRKDDFDLVLMDIQMPEMDGREATRLIRQMPGHKGRVCVIAVSANCDVEMAEAVTKDGFDDTLVKPIRPAGIAFLINQIMKRGLAT